MNKPTFHSARLRAAALAVCRAQTFLAPVAAVAVTGAAAGAAAPAAEEKTEFDVILVDGGSNKIAVIKEIRGVVSGLGLAEAKALVDKGGQAVKNGVPKAEAEEIKKKLEAAGAKVEIK